MSLLSSLRTGHVARRSLLGALGGALAGAAGLTPVWARAGFRDPLDTPAEKRSSPDRRALLAVATAGAAWVAVGSRGLIVRSEDQGRQWVQSDVPVASDLLAVHFPSPSMGWAVGHDGVVLHSADGGRTWVRQLDGRSAATAFEAFYADASAAHNNNDAQGDVQRQAALAQVRKNMGNGPALPFLDVWFESEQKGFVVGSFGQLAGTQDGGKTWAPWMHRIDNPDQLNLNALRGVGGRLCIAGERGQVFELDRTRGRFQAQDTGYNGSFFGIAGSTRALLAFGLRGTAYRHDARTPGAWSPVQMPTEHTLTAGLYDPSSGFVLVDTAGQLLLGGVDGLQWQVVPPARPLRASGVSLVDARTAMLSSLDGMRLTPLQSPEPRQAAVR